MAEFNDDIVFRKELQKGNKKAFAFLFEIHYSNLCHYIQSFSKDPGLSQDVVQNCFAILWEQKSKINPKKSIKSYLYKIAYNQLINELRKQQKKEQYIDEIKKTGLDYFIEKDEQEISRIQRRVLNEINNLPEKCKEAFLLHKKSGLKYKEIAEELNISIKTVEKHISKALKHVRKIMASSGTHKYQ